MIGLDYDVQQAIEVSRRDGSERVEGATCTAEPFGPADVAETIASDVWGEDETEVRWVGRLVDGRFAFVTAWADYTGWG